MADSGGAQTADGTHLQPGRRRDAPTAVDELEFPAVRSGGLSNPGSVGCRAITVPADAFQGETLSSGWTLSEYVFAVGSCELEEPAYLIYATAGSARQMGGDGGGEVFT